MSTPDVIIVGAGLAGAAAANLLARQRRRVLLVDPRPEFPPLFRAEKIEPDQAGLLNKFGLFGPVERKTGRIHEITRASRGRVRYRRSIEQYGIHYQDLVNSVRGQLPPEVECRLGQVTAVVPDPDRPKVVLADGEEIAARLVVVSCGTGGKLQEQLGMTRTMVARELSVAFGFDLVRPDGQPFPFDAVTYHPSSIRNRIGYLTLFRIQQSMRANLFVYWSVHDEVTRTFIKEPRASLETRLPGVAQVIGDYAIPGRVETCRIDLYRVEDPVRPGVVLLADAYQSVCPTTGMGLSKVLTDVDVLCHDCVPGWMSTPGMGEDKIRQFHEAGRKQATDQAAWLGALHGRELATSRSLKNRARRIYRHWRWSTGR